VKEAEYGKDVDVQVKVCGSRTVGASSSTRPTTIDVHSEAVEFSYDDTCRLVRLSLTTAPFPHPNPNR
jgi:hypothetical protein